jgi:peptide deformylase
MALLKILRYPDPRLRKVAAPVVQVDDRLRRLVDDMLHTMYAAGGMGLSATQVDVHERVVVMDTSATRDQPLVLINPEIAAHSDEWVVGDEGCLSVPMVMDKVRRRARVTCRALDRDGAPFSFSAGGLAAVCVQHELDHLQGKVFVEHLSPLRRSLLMRRMLRKPRAPTAS